MKRIALLLLVAFGSALLLYAEDSPKGTPMTGWVCNSKCVVQSAGHASCDQNCSEKSGDAVFVDDQGRVLKISDKNQDMAKEHMGKHMKIMASMDEQQKELERIHFLNQQAP